MGERPPCLSVCPTKKAFLRVPAGPFNGVAAAGLWKGGIASGNQSVEPYSASGDTSDSSRLVSRANVMVAVTILRFGFQFSRGPSRYCPFGLGTHVSHFCHGLSEPQAINVLVIKLYAPVKLRAGAPQTTDNLDVKKQ